MLRTRRSSFVTTAVIALLAAGCGSSSTDRSHGEASAVLVSFYEALIREDWPAAHAVLHPDSQARCPLDQFTSLARVYRRRLGFEPQHVRIRACEEHDATALVHVVLIGNKGGREQSYRDALTLQRIGNDWWVVLPIRFGRPH